MPSSITTALVGTELAADLSVFFSGNDMSLALEEQQPRGKISSIARRTKDCCSDIEILRLLFRIFTGLINTTFLEHLESAQVIEGEGSA
eukprot:CAMPEP_0185268978 /NCGR_PEP_ID=MMETSP1359-20130426/38518_1 /TAXON_ID=552665 /ORGANISM="Bigelowiella longifila, Strain CCMP242" /LENGTH=88 /DNA_ID=CAMNT_0027859953 /DNA_START=477 /DNA_END=743 /DNA_ORIENTATION=+